MKVNAVICNHYYVHIQYVKCEDLVWCTCRLSIKCQYQLYCCIIVHVQNCTHGTLVTLVTLEYISHISHIRIH